MNQVSLKNSRSGCHVKSSTAHVMANTPTSSAVLQHLQSEDPNLASFPFPLHRPVFGCLQHPKWRGKAWSILSHEWHFVYLGRQRRGGSWSHFTYVFFVLKQEWYVICFTNVWNSSTWGRNYRIRTQACFFDQEPFPLPPSVYLGTQINVRPSPSDFAHCKRSKSLDSGKAWEQGSP